MSSPLAISTPLSAERTVRGLTRLQLFMMSFGAIVGVGWITILGQWLSLAGPGGSVIALVAGGLGPRAALVPIVNVAALCFGLVYLLICLTAWRYAVTAGRRCIAALGVAVAGSMAVYVFADAVAGAGWRAPEFGIVVLAVVAGTVLRVMRSQHADWRAARERLP